MSAEEILRLFAKKVRGILETAQMNLSRVSEIRLRVHAPLLLIYQEKEIFLDDRGNILQNVQDAYQVTRDDICQTLEYAAQYSLYAFSDEIRQGFLTVYGGHRIGLAGKVVLEEGKIKTITDICYINIRISHEIKGCADKVLPYLEEKEGILHTLIISPPRWGKTTLLRDLIRQISDGTGLSRGYCVGVVDERSEIGGCFQGEAQNDLGIRTDVLDCCPKAKGMLMLIRSMSPEVIAVDELGDERDIYALEQAVYCGCKILATVHGSSIEEIQRKPFFGRLFEQKVFERFLILKKEKMRRIEIFDSRGERMGTE